MKLRYRNTIEDLAAFNVHVFSGSPVVTRQAWFAAITIFVVWTSVLIIGAPGWDWAMDTAASILSLFIYLAFGLFIAVAVYFLMRLLVVKQIRRNTHLINQHKPDKMALCEHELQLIDGKLVERNEFAETRWEIAAVEQVAATPQHVFIFMSSIRAHILPREGLGERELDDFVQELERQRHEPAISVAPVPSSQDIRVDRSSLQR